MEYLWKYNETEDLKMIALVLKITVNAVAYANPPSMKYEEISIWSFNSILAMQRGKDYLTFLCLLLCSKKQIIKMVNFMG